MTSMGPPGMAASEHTVLNGSCFCGELSYQVTGAPALSAFCHCTNCQRLTGCPFIHTLHFDAAHFRWTHAEPHATKLDLFVIPSKNWKTRARCKNCGSVAASSNSRTGRWSVWAAHLERGDDGKIKDYDRIKPTAHQFYGTRMLDINDHLSKWVGYEGHSERVI